MGIPLIVGGIVTVFYVLLALIMRMVLQETTLAYLFLWLIFGIPVIISYFVLVILYFKASRKVFYSILALMLAVGFAIVVYDSLTGPVL